jgi:hypothetical protein
MPTGSSDLSRAIVRLRFSPSRSTSPLRVIETARPIASRPLKRIVVTGGSAKPRRTCAMSPSLRVCPPARSNRSEIACTESSWPVTRNATEFWPVSTDPGGRIAFCAASAWPIICGSIPSAPSRFDESST